MAAACIVFARPGWHIVNKLNELKNIYDPAQRLTTSSRIILLLLLSTVLSVSLRGQDLAPRAYVITPTSANAVNVTYSYFNGGVDFNGAIPLTDTKGVYNVSILSYYRSFGLFGHSANILVAQPYAIGNFHGTFQNTIRMAHLSGMLDTAFRFAVNLKGGKAMPAREFVKWKQKTLVGVSIKVIVPTGQYDPNRLVNWGVNRWALKPEMGISHRHGDWVIDGAAGVWFFTKNNNSYTGSVPRPQILAPIGSLEGHISYDIGKSKRLWASFDGNFWFGGTSTLAGVTNPATRQTSSRLGGTFSFPLNKHQSIKTSYSNGVYGRFGGNYQNVSISWQYSWLDKSK